MRACGALAVLAARSMTYRISISEAGAIAPLVRQLGDGFRVENDTPQERAASVLADLARSSESKEEIVEAGGVLLLVRMLRSNSNKAQTSAAVALAHPIAMNRPSTKCWDIFTARFTTRINRKNKVTRSACNRDQGGYFAKLAPSLQMAIYCQRPKGRNHRISLGRRVKEASNAIAIPSAVKTPK